MHIAEPKRAQDHEAGRLLELLPRQHARIGDASCPLAVCGEVDTRDPGVGFQGEVLVAKGRRDHGDMRAGLGIGLTSEILAEAAILALAELNAVRIGVGAAHVGGGARKRMISELLRRLREHFAGEARLERRVRILARARPLEGIASLHNPAGDVARLPGDARHILELVVVRFELGITHRPVGQLHVRRDEGFAISLFHAGTQCVVMRRKAIGLSVPVHAGAAHAFARQEGAEPAHRQRLLARLVAERQGIAADIHEQLIADGITQLVTDHRHREVGA